MIYLVTAILLNTLLPILFKVFPKLGIDTFTAIIYNYITAGLTGILFLNDIHQADQVVYSAWFIMAVPLGALFIGVFYFISLSTQRISVATTSVANKMSVAMPVLFSVIFLGQQLTPLKITGILTALISVYLSSKGGENKGGSSNWWWLPLLVFIGSGLIDIAMNAANAYYMRTPDDNALFSITIFLSAFCFGVITIIYKTFVNKAKTVELIRLKNIIAGITLGIPNYFSIFFTLKALDSNILISARLFPVMNLSVVVLSALSAFFLFKEQPKTINVIGIVLAVISIFLIAL